MFSFNKKLDINLKIYATHDPTKNYRVIIKYKNFQDLIIKKILSYKGTILRDIKDCNIITASLNFSTIERLIEYPEIEYITLDKYFHLCGMSVQSANKVRLSEKFSLSGKGVGLGVIDSGVYPHSDLTLPFNRIITFKDLINELLYPYDDNGHGTCTCGIIAGSGYSSNGIYKGISPEVNLHCYKAFDKLGKGFVSDVLFSISDIINISAKNNIKVLCLPFELLAYDKFIYELFDTMLNRCIQNGIVPILPTGSNKNTDGSMTGISLSKNCITVAGIDTTLGIEPYEYSSAGNSKKDTKPNFCAACVDLVSLNCNTTYLSQKDNIKIYAPKLSSSYKSFTGTSLAAAYVAGLCALLYEDNISLSFNDICSLLKLAAVELDIPKNLQGDGKININKILKK